MLDGAVVEAVVNAFNSIVGWLCYCPPTTTTTVLLCYWATLLHIQTRVIPILSDLPFPQLPATWLENRPTLPEREKQKKKRL